MNFVFIPAANAGLKRRDLHHREVPGGRRRSGCLENDK